MIWSWHFFPHFILFLILKNFFNWRIIALQCCVGFCNTTAWISHKYTYIPSLLYISSIPPPLHPTPLGCHRALGCDIQQLPLPFYSTYVNIYVSMLLSQFVPPSPSSVVSTNLFSIYMYPFFILKKIFFNTRFL